VEEGRSEFALVLERPYDEHRLLRSQCHRNSEQGEELPEMSDWKRRVGCPQQRL
jgi:hypothetical protein